MGWNGAGSYSRAENFSADSSAGIKILATRMDTELDDFASAMTLALTRNGQNSPTANIPMAGFRFTNVGAAASAEDYIRTKEFIKDVPVYVKETGTANNVRVSVAPFVSVSAGQSPPDGTRLKIQMGTTNGAKTSTTCSFFLFTPLNTSAGGLSHTAPVWTRGRKYDPNALRAGQIYEFCYDASASGWNVLNPSPSYLQAQIVAKTYTAGAVVAGQASGAATLAISRISNYLSFSLATSVSVSCSLSAAYFVFSANNLTSLTSGISGVAAYGSIPITVKDVISSPWGLHIVGNQIRAEVLSNTAGTTASAACTVRALPFTTTLFAQ